MQIAASVTSGDIGRLAEMASIAEAGGADRIHLDIEDGVFIPSFTVGPRAVAAVRAVTRLPLEVHLQTADPERWIAPVVERGADLVIFHPEGTCYPFRALRLIRDAGARVGVALLLATPVEHVIPVIDQADQITIMTADPEPADHFHAAALAKVRALKGRRADIELDGGVSAEMMPAAVQAGATVVVAGRAIFGQGVDAVAASIAGLRALRESE